MVTCQDFIPLDTTLLLTKDVVLNIHRDLTVYGNVHFKLWNPEDEKPVVNAEVEIASRKVTSDSDGHVTMFVPLEEQRTKYFIKSTVPLANDTVYLPCGPDDVILTK